MIECGARIFPSPSGEGKHQNQTLLSQNVRKILDTTLFSSRSRGKCNQQSEQEQLKFLHLFLPDLIGPAPTNVKSTYGSSAFRAEPTCLLPRVTLRPGS
jgi:hypothetical protein